MNKYLKYRFYFNCIVLISFMGLYSCSDDEIGEVLVSSIQVQGSYITDGGTSQMVAVILPENATDQEVVWSVSNENIATIDQDGLLTAVSNGTVTVTATATDGSGVSGKKIIGVNGIEEPAVLVESITVSGSDITNGSSTQFTAEILPINADNKQITWSVSDETMATINENGFLTPLKDGTVDVIAAASDGSGVTGSLTITISGTVNVDDGYVVATETEILNAINNAVAGDKIYIRGGNYIFSQSIRLSQSGQDGNMISVFAYPNDEQRPVFDFSSMAESSSNRGVILSGNYWHVKGIDVYNAGDNGMFIGGSYNLIEFCSFYENSDTGLQIGNGGAYNTVLNCDSYFNADASIENADGFAAKLDCGTGNKFIGCRAWNNLDDGWDGYLRGADNITTTYENCWAFRNGYLKNGSISGGDGNGFKTGGSDTKDLKHNAEFTRCIAAENAVDGFDHNSNRGDITIYHASAHANGRNISFGTTNIASTLIIKNSMSFGGNQSDSYNATTTDISNNSWQNGLSVTSSDFKSINVDMLLSPRKADGSLPEIDYLYLVEGSDLINKGVDVGLDFIGPAPDLGAFEFGQ